MIPEKFSNADVYLYKCQFYQFHILTLYCHEVCFVVFSSCHFLGFPCDSCPRTFFVKVFHIVCPCLCALVHQNFYLMYVIIP